MNEKVLTLINKYEKHLKNGETNLQEFRYLGFQSGPEYQQQVAINAIWRMVLNDFASLADNNSYESKEK